MTEREFYIHTVADELPRFERLVLALPVDNAEYRPDPKSKTGLELATYMVVDAYAINPILKTGEVDFSHIPTQHFASPSEAATALVGVLTESKTIAEEMTDLEWDGSAKMLMNGHVAWETARGKMAFSLLLDLIHHRGQLSTYIRPMGGSVPSIYGPSADTPE